MLKKPSIFSKPNFTFLREFVYEASTHPLLFPPLLPSNAARLESTNSRQDLTKQVAVCIYQRREIPTDPILLVTTKEVTEERVKCPDTKKGATQNLPMIRLTLHAADGDDNKITIKIASQLSTSCSLLEVGSIIKMQSFTPIYFNYNDEEDDRLAILLFSFRILGIMHIPLPIRFTEYERLPLLKLEDKKPAAQITTSDPTLCRGELCSTDRVRFQDCITKCCPVSSLVLTEISNTCPFVTMEVSQMTNSYKRNMLYWWFATNVYVVTGANNRKKRGDCVVHAI